MTVCLIKLSLSLLPPSLVLMQMLSKFFRRFACFAVADAEPGQMREMILFISNLCQYGELQVRPRVQSSRVT